MKGNVTIFTTECTAGIPKVQKWHFQDFALYSELKSQISGKVNFQQMLTVGF
jgi:hypothetical protein